MGKGDKKTRRGKIWKGSYGVRRSRKKKVNFVKTPSSSEKVIENITPHTTTSEINQTVATEELITTPSYIENLETEIKEKVNTSELDTKYSDKKDKEKEVKEFEKKKIQKTTAKKTVPAKTAKDEAKTVEHPEKSVKKSVSAKTAKDETETVKDKVKTKKTTLKKQIETETEQVKTPKTAAKKPAKTKKTVKKE